MKRFKLLKKEYVVIEKDELYGLLEEIRKHAIGIEVYAEGMDKYANSPDQLVILGECINRHNDVIKKKISNYILEL